MGRPSKSTKVTSKHLTKDEIANRTETEDMIRGDDDKLIPPSYLTDDQVDLFYYIKNELEESHILGNLDVFVLAQASICIDRLNKFEELINDDESYLLNNAFMSSKSKYSADFFKCCQELCLSPQSRAKISLNVINSKEVDALDFLNE